MSGFSSDQFFFAYCALGAVFLGSLPFGWLIAKLWGIEDLRTVGSSNVGATNVVRTAGWLPGALTFLFDFGKGYVPTVYFAGIAPDTIKDVLGPCAAVFGALAVLGHCYSPFLRFRGGKGVSSMLGLAMGVSPILGSVCIGVYVAFALISRVSALGSLSAVFVFFFGALFFLNDGVFKICALIVTFVVVHRHEKNWNDALKGAAAIVFVGLLISHSSEAKDFRGKELPVERPKRIVALMPAIAETIEDLGKGALIVGAPMYTHLHGAKPKDLGPYTNIAAESVAALKPDVVFASIDGNVASLVEQLERVKIRVVTINTQTLEDILKSIQMIAAVIGESENPKIAALEKALKPKHSKKPAIRVFLQIGWDPVVGVGPKTFVHELLMLAGGENVIDKSPTKYPVINAEEVVQRNPQIILITKLTDDANAEQQAEAAKKYWQRFKGLDAVKNNRIRVITGDDILKPGFRLIEGAKKLRALFAEAS